MVAVPFTANSDGYSGSVPTVSFLTNGLINGEYLNITLYLSSSTYTLYCDEILLRLAGNSGRRNEPFNANSTSPASSSILVEVYLLEAIVPVPRPSALGESVFVKKVPLLLFITKFSILVLNVIFRRAILAFSFIVISEPKELLKLPSLSETSLISLTILYY